MENVERVAYTFTSKLETRPSYYLFDNKASREMSRRRTSVNVTSVWNRAEHRRKRRVSIAGDVPFRLRPKRVMDDDDRRFYR